MPRFYLFLGAAIAHRLPPEYREWLSAAAMLYEVGDYVNRNGRHRHTHYIISNSEILGYTPSSGADRSHCALSGEIAPDRKTDR